jgi:Nuclease-related domain
MGLGKSKPTSMMNSTILTVAVAAGMLGLLMGFGRLWLWEEGRRKRRKPVTEKLLRSPGETLRLQIEELDDKLLPWLSVVAFAPIIMVSSYTLTHKNLGSDLTQLVTDIGIGGLMTMIAIWRILKLVKRRKNLRLGFSGERAVGEELNKLMLDGFQVFHDVPFDKYNIDHVIVGPSGVFAVETKTRRKLELEKPVTGDEHRIVLYGGKVLFPSGHKEEKSLEQARWNARTLSKFLTSSTGEKVEVQPILTYPGWFVESGDSSDVGVLNPKMIRNFVVRNGPAVLSEQRIRQIVHQLDQKCRTVEF